MDFDTIATILNALDKINLKLSQLKNEKIFI